MSLPALSIKRPITTLMFYLGVFLFGVIEKEVPKLKEGQNVELSLDSYPDEIFKGQIDSLSPVVEGRSRTMKVRAKISNPDEKIKPGMFGRVSALVYEKEDALVIPSAAFKKKEDQYTVYVVHAEEAFEEEAPDAEQPPMAEPKASFEETSKATLGTVEVRNIEVAYATPDSIEVK